MHEIEVVRPRLQRTVGAQRKRARLAERAAQELEHLDGIGPLLDFPVGGEATGIEVVEDVEARQLVHLDARIEHRVRLTAVHLDVMTEVDERLREVARVHALPTDVGFAAVREVRDAQRAVAQTVMHRAHVVPHRHACGRYLWRRLRDRDINAVASAPAQRAMTSTASPMWE